MKHWEKKVSKKNCNLETIKEESILYCKKYKAYIEIPAMVLGVVLFFIVSEYSGLVTTNDYCVECITNGTLEKYEQVRKEQHEILMSTEEMDVIIPEAEAPYPMINMVLQGYAEDSRNMDRAKYYGKNSIVAEMVD